MELADFIKMMSVPIKSNLLGPDVTQLLRLTTTNQFGVLSVEVLNHAVIVAKSHYLVNNRRGRLLVLNSLTEQEKMRLRFRSGDENELRAISDAQSFCALLQLPISLVQHPAPDYRLPFENCKPTYGEISKSRGALHHYQLELKNRLLDGYTKSAWRRLLCTMPTGAGKTATAIEFLIDVIRANPIHCEKQLHIMWVVDGEILAEQSLNTFKSFWNLKGDRQVRINRFFSPFEECSLSTIPTITFATFSLSTRRLQTLQFQETLKSQSILIIDEAHSANADTFREVVETYLNKNERGRVIGLTATPYRPDDNAVDNLRRMFDRVFSITREGHHLESPIRHLVSLGFLANVRFVVLEHSEAATDPHAYYKRLHEGVKHVCQNHISEGKKLIIFAESMSHAVSLKIMLDLVDMESELIVGETPQILREEYLQRLADPTDSLCVVINHNILSKGVDVPGLNSVMILGEISNPALALQILGRAMRGPKNGGNTENTVYLTDRNYRFLENMRELENLTQWHQ